MNLADLLPCLCCPETRQTLAVADADLLARLNARVARGELRNKAGEVVTEKLDGGLIRADEQVLYPVRQDIPVLLVDEGIPL